ncbi:unnamed protein product [Medioppia subpectinata]|uniref:C2H2-type domain-containing protein n=1 Tax=Medioppia subpectinata TaxID=1979941 RepID=A0A7R9LNI7_9ACAR|nr:unnamed protein product [Medioppia subpectinata]CAG2120325.1 unnamed protein product [Medioppia subpectinata]
MTKTEDGRDLDLRERIVRLKRFVARPKTYAKRAPKCDPKTEHTFACVWPQCHKQFKAKVDMKTHLWRHTGDKQYVCEWPGCGKRFPIKRNLTRHRETHEGTKAFACDWPGCDYKSWYPQGVRAHKKRHTDERPYKCRHCEWTFRQSHHLKAHTLKHTGEKPFGCEHEGCVQRFQSRQAMKFHFERTHRAKDETMG